MKKAVFLIAGALLLSIFLTACGTAGGGASPSTSPSAAVTTSESPAASTPASTSASASPSPSATPETTVPSTSDAPTIPDTEPAGMTLQDLVTQLQSVFDGLSNDQAKYLVDLQGNNVTLTVQVLAVDKAADAGDPSAFSDTFDSQADIILSSIQQVSSSATLTLLVTAADDSVIYSKDVS